MSQQNEIIVPKVREPEEIQAAIRSSGAALQNAGESLMANSSELSDRFKEASIAFKELEIRCKEVGYAGDILPVLADDLSTQLFSSWMYLVDKDAAAFQLNLVDLHISTQILTSEIGKEILKAQIKESVPDVNLFKIVENLSTSCLKIEQLLEGADQASIVEQMTKVGESWAAAGSGLTAWSDGLGLGLGIKAWNDSCTCGTNSPPPGSGFPPVHVCVVSFGMFCDTCEWALLRPPGP